MSSCATSGPKRRVFKDAGRACPIDYRIPPTVYDGTPDLTCDVLYVVGGLYGNPFALEAVDAMLSREEGKTLAVFNGDMHWFDKTAENFENIENKAAAHYLMVGNVEAELRRQTDVGVGCGCAYPECTADDSVSRSNRIHKMLSVAMEKRPDLKALLKDRPAVCSVNVSGKKVAITHGDEKLIGGWDNSRESLQDLLRQDELDTYMAAHDIDVFACTHTCATAALALAHGLVINNGAAGLPNFAGQRYGLLIRIAASAHPDALISAQRDGLFVEAVPVRYDHDAYLQWFDALWETNSPAAVSYRSRIVNGPADFAEDALLGGFSLASHALEANEPGLRHPAVDRDVAAADAAALFAKQVFFEDMVDDPACLRANTLDTIQVNITAQCNLQCEHCHVGSNPRRTEACSRATLQAVLDVARQRKVSTIDITGGAPELHPDFEWFLAEACATVEHVIVRSNLVILESAAYQHLPQLYAQLGVEVVASLPNVFEAQACSQRGSGSYDASLRLLRTLNALGFGEDPQKTLSVTYNPQHPILPPEQGALEEVYRRRLGSLGIAFTNLYAISNCPIGRYGEHLVATTQMEGYLDLLQDAFNQDACPHMMCRSQISVGWDGRLYDCDFNQALNLPIQFCPDTSALAEFGDEGRALTIFDVEDNPTLSLERPIIFGAHCYACTAGQGSSCGGTLVQEA